MIQRRSYSSISKFLNLLCTNRNASSSQALAAEMHREYIAGTGRSFPDALLFGRHLPVHRSCPFFGSLRHDGHSIRQQHLVTSSMKSSPTLALFRSAGALGSLISVLHRRGSIRVLCDHRITVDADTPISVKLQEFLCSFERLGFIVKNHHQLAIHKSSAIFRVNHLSAFFEPVDL